MNDFVTGSAEGLVLGVLFGAVFIAAIFLRYLRPLGWFLLIALAVWALAHL